MHDEPHRSKTRSRNTYHPSSLPQTKVDNRTRFRTKVAIEKTITSKNETLHLVMLDMSKAFDSINRKVLLDHLRNTIYPDELRIVKKMLEVTVAVRCGQRISETFTTDTGALQVDCASANSFVYYLAKSTTNKTPDMLIHDHQYHHQQIVNHELPDEIQNHNYAITTQVEHLNLDMEYVDDMTKLTSDFNNARKYEYDAEVNLKTPITR